MKYAILLKDRQKEDKQNINEYLDISGIIIDKHLVFENFAVVCKHFNSGDSVIIASVATLGQHYEEIIKNVKLLAQREVVLYTVQEQILINTTLPQTIGKLADICLGLYKGILSFKNKKIQDDLLKQGKPRGAPRNGQLLLQAHDGQIKKLLDEGENLTRIAKQINCSRSTLLRYVKNNVE
ncbi:MAG: helix-turn-helix domain-containing protein [Alphaproteobacteria bacterium]|nr:helix-turn-helix domain-containing protein [Alphaproteobacteria bacterium]